VLDCEEASFTPCQPMSMLWEGLSAEELRVAGRYNEDCSQLNVRSNAMPLVGSRDGVVQVTIPTEASIREKEKSE
jgi:hypothetical protein